MCRKSQVNSSRVVLRESCRTVESGRKAGIQSRSRDAKSWNVRTKRLLVGQVFAVAIRLTFVRIPRLIPLGLIRTQLASRAGASRIVRDVGNPRPVHDLRDRGDMHNIHYLSMRSCSILTTHRSCHFQNYDNQVLEGCLNALRSFSSASISLGML